MSRTITPGRWDVEIRPGVFRVVDGVDLTRVAQKMFEALEESVDWLEIAIDAYNGEPTNPGPRKAIEQARAALALARGEEAK